MTRTCADCPAELGSRNRSGRCRSCVMRAVRACPEYEAKRAAAFRRAIAANPEWHQRHCAASAARLEIWRRTPEGSAFFKANSHKATAASNTPEARAKRSAAVRAALTGWCPDEWRDAYHKMRREVGAAEARRLIEEDMAAQERRRLASMTGLERQMERLRNGAKLVDVVPLRKADPAFTLGGVATGAL